VRGCAHEPRSWGCTYLAPHAWSLQSTFSRRNRHINTPIHHWQLPAHFAHRRTFSREVLKRSQAISPPMLAISSGWLAATRTDLFDIPRIVNSIWSSVGLLVWVEWWILSLRGWGDTSKLTSDLLVNYSYRCHILYQITMNQGISERELGESNFRRAMAMMTLTLGFQSHHHPSVPKASPRNLTKLGRREPTRICVKISLHAAEDLS
jgi:hypothetical protein